MRARKKDSIKARYYAILLSIFSILKNNLSYYS